MTAAWPLPLAGAPAVSAAGVPAVLSAAAPAVPVAELVGRTGFELELLAPPGSSRADLAEDLAARGGGDVRPFFHVDSEPSLVSGMDHFLHLTQGFAVHDGQGAPLCRLVDDITLRSDLDAASPPRPGWYRILTDDPRLVRLVSRLADPAAPLGSVLDPVAAVFGVRTEQVDGVARVDDGGGATVALAAPLSGGRERACEVITPPLRRHHRAALARLLGPARELGFTVPAEAAVHLHVDAAPLRSPQAFANLVRLFSAWRDPVRRALGTNPRCRRLGPLPAAVVDLVARGVPDRWEDVCEAVAPLGLTKFADVNLTALVQPRPDRDTVEIRCLPGSLDPDGVMTGAALVEALLRRCRDPRPLPAPRPGASVRDLLAS